MYKKLEFFVHTSRKCFICFNPIISEGFEENKISLKRICQYLKIDLSKTITVPPSLLSSLSKSDITVNLCLNCAKVVQNLTKLCENLEVIKLRVEYDCKKLHEQLESVNNNPELLLEYAEKLELDSRAKLHSVIVEKLRVELSSKCNEIKQHIYPAIIIKRVKWVQPKREREPPLYEDMSSAGSPAAFPDLDFDFENESDSESQPVIKNEPKKVKPTVILPGNNQCGACALTFSSKSNLTRHKRQTCPGSDNSNKAESLPNQIHNKGQTFRCKLCPFSFSSMNGLGTHLTRTHSLPQNKARNHKCDVCGKRFFDRKHLKNHQTIHLGIKFECDLCGKKFSQKGALGRHKRLKCSGRKIKEEAISGNNEDKHKCEICKKCFPTEQSLKTHVGLIHPIKSELKRFPCSCCNKRFLTPMHLKNHYNNKHLGIRFKCGFCNFIGNQAGSVYDHQLSGKCPNFKKKGRMGLKRVIKLKPSNKMKTEADA